jgi:putative transposase
LQGRGFSRAVTAENDLGFSPWGITMARPPRDPLSSRPGTYFITANAAGKRNLFQSERMGSLFLEIIRRYRTQGKYLLHEYTLMPNHCHLLLTTAEGTSLAKAAQFIKGGYSFEAGKMLGSKAEIWRAGLETIAF